MLFSSSPDCDKIGFFFFLFDGKNSNSFTRLNSRWRLWLHRTLWKMEIIILPEQVMTICLQPLHTNMHIILWITVIIPTTSAWQIFRCSDYRVGLIHSCVLKLNRAESEARSFEYFAVITLILNLNHCPRGNKQTGNNQRVNCSDASEKKERAGLAIYP